MMKLYTYKQIAEFLPVSRTTLIRWMKAGYFPQCFRRPANNGDIDSAYAKRYWSADEVDKWFQIRLNER